MSRKGRDGRKVKEKEEGVNGRSDDGCACLTV